jgi:hypothetical protein
MDHGRLYEEGATRKKTIDSTFKASKAKRIQSNVRTRQTNYLLKVKHMKESILQIGMEETGNTKEFYQQIKRITVTRATKKLERIEKTKGKTTVAMKRPRLHERDKRNRQ